MSLPETSETKVRIALVAVPETSASVLYGLFDVLASVGRTWSDLTGEPEQHDAFDLSIVAESPEPFRCHGGLPVHPDGDLASADAAEIIILSDLAVAKGFDPRGRWPGVVAWLKERYAAGAVLCSVCTGLALLAETGFLRGQQATTHWALHDMIESLYPEVDLRREAILVVSGPEDRLISCGGAASWEDLALYLIRRFRSEAEAVRTAKIFLFGDRGEGQLPYVVQRKHPTTQDAVIADCQAWIAEHYAHSNPVARMAERSGLSERSFKRRFRAETGLSPIEYVQALRVEEAKQYLETSDLTTDAVARAVGYEDTPFFRRLFKRRSGITPARYRQRFQGIGASSA